jgi:hypothetical protein
MFVMYVKRDHTPRHCMWLEPGMDKLLSSVTPWMMMKFVSWQMVRHVLSIVRTTNGVRPGVLSSPTSSIRTI